MISDFIFYLFFLLYHYERWTWRQICPNTEIYWQQIQHFSGSDTSETLFIFLKTYFLTAQDVSKVCIIFFSFTISVNEVDILSQGRLKDLKVFQLNSSFALLVVLFDKILVCQISYLSTYHTNYLSIYQSIYRHVYQST